MALNSKEIKERIESQGLISGFIDLEKQITPNGFDLTVDKVFEFLSFGAIDFDNQKREVSKTRQIDWKDNWVTLEKGFYKVRTNEFLKMPLDLVAIGRPRSTLSRSGVAIDAGVWDAGFEGKSEFLLIVGNSLGFTIRKDARIIQLVFFRIKKVKKGYDGVYSVPSDPSTSK